MIAWLTSSLWRPYLYILEENRSDLNSSSSSKNTIKKPKANLKSILGLNRGGAQVLIHPGDLAFLEIHAIKTKRKLDGQVFQYGTKNAKFKVKKIVQKIKNNRVVISVYTVATFYIAALADNKKIGIPNGGRTPSTPSQSLENTRTTSIKETAIQGTKILLPGSDVILLVKKPIQESPKVYQTTRPSSASRFKNRNNVSKKRVGLQFLQNNAQVLSLGLGFYQVRLVIRQMESIKSNAQEITILIENNHKELTDRIEKSQRTNWFHEYVKPIVTPVLVNLSVGTVRQVPRLINKTSNKELNEQLANKNEEINNVKSELQKKNESLKEMDKELKELYQANNAFSENEELFMSTFDDMKSEKRRSQDRTQFLEQRLEPELRFAFLSFNWF